MFSDVTLPNDLWEWFELEQKVDDYHYVLRLTDRGAEHVRGDVGRVEDMFNRAMAG